MANWIKNYVARRTEIIKANSGVSSKRYISVTSARVIFILAFALLFVEIPENNVEIIKLIIGLLSGVILGESGFSMFEKKNKVDKKENNTENIE